MNNTLKLTICWRPRSKVLKKKRKKRRIIVKRSTKRTFTAVFGTVVEWLLSPFDDQQVNAKEKSNSCIIYVLIAVCICFHVFTFQEAYKA